MCDLNRVSNLLISAKVLYVGTLVALSIAAVNAGSLFAAAANVPLMVGVIAAAAAATSLYVAALASFDACNFGACAAVYAPLRRDIVAAVALITGYSLLLTGLALVAWIPFAGALAVASVLTILIPFTVAILSLAEWSFLETSRKFNECRRRALESALSELATVAAVASIAASWIFGGLGVATGAFSVRGVRG